MTAKDLKEKGRTNWMDEFDNSEEGYLFTNGEFAMLWSLISKEQREICLDRKRKLWIESDETAIRNAPQPKFD